MARAVARKAVKKAAAKKAAKKPPVQKRKAVAAKKVAPARKSAPKVAPKAARKATRKAAPKKEGRKTDLRVVAADGQPVKAPKVSAMERRLALAAQLHEKEPERDTSMIIVDYHQLRTEAIRAMGGDIESADARDLVEVEGVMVVRGSFATEAKGEFVVKKIREQKKGAGTVFNVHPLDFHVLTGDQRINTRDFSTPAMIKRVAELTYDIAANGVQLELKAFARNDLLYGMSGETRWRATAHAHILKSRGFVENAPPSIPVILIAKGKDDAYIQLDVIKQNMVFPQPPLEIAEGIAKSFHLGNTVEKIAKYMNETKAWVEGRIAIMEMPARVKNMIREGEITIPFASRVWEAEKQDPDQTVATLEFALRQAKAQGSTRAMPRHLPPKADAPAPRKTTAKAPVEEAASGEANDEVTAFGDALRTGTEGDATSTVEVGVTMPSTVTVDSSEVENLRAENERLKQQIAEVTAHNGREVAELKKQIAEVTAHSGREVAELKKQVSGLKGEVEKEAGRVKRLTKHLDNVGAVVGNCVLRDNEDGTTSYVVKNDQVAKVVCPTWNLDIPAWVKNPEEEPAAEVASNEDTGQNEAAA